MDSARAPTTQGLQVFRGGVAFVAGEIVLGVKAMVGRHAPVPVDLGQNRGCGDDGAAVVPLNDGLLGVGQGQGLVERAANAATIYFAGRNTGVAEELTLKTNEITRKKADFLEGTYAVHGIEEVMYSEELIVVVEPFESEEQKFRECLVDGVGLEIAAISTGRTSFPTVVIPDAGDYRSYVEIAAGWNLLVEIGLALGIDLDKPERARKVILYGSGGEEFHFRYQHPERRGLWEHYGGFEGVIPNLTRRYRQTKSAGVRSWIERFNET